MILFDQYGTVVDDRRRRALARTTIPIHRGNFMRRLIASLYVIVCLAPQCGAAAAKGTLSACSILTKELVTQVTPYDKKALDLALRVPAREDAVGQGGSECSYGGITMNVDAFAPAAFERLRDQTWVPLPNLGDRAHFRDNKGRWAELYVLAGSHVLTIQMDVPNGRTAASIQPNVIALAKAVLPQLK